MSITVLFIFIIISTFIGGVIWLLQKHLFQSEIKKSLNTQLFLISIPRELSQEDDKRKEVKDFILPFEQLLEQFSHYSKDITLEIANPFGSEEICFYVAINKNDSDLLVKIVSSLYPSAAIEPAKEYTIFNPHTLNLGGIVKLKQHFALPLKTFLEAKEDSLATLINAFSKTTKDEGMACQIIFHADQFKKNKILTQIKKDLQEGKSLKEAIASPSSLVQESLKEQLSLIKKKEGEENKPKIIDDSSIKLIEEKSQYPLYDVNIRFLISSLTQTRQEELFSHFKEFFNIFYHPLGNDFQINLIKKGRALKNLIYNFSFRIFKDNEVCTLNSVELASLYHFPHPFINNPRVKWLKARFAPPPLNLPQDGIILGISVFEGMEKEVRIRDEDRRRHVYAVGQTGTGKTTLLKSSFLQDIHDGKGGAFIDPHGDAALDILGLIPDSRKNDVIYFNPGDPQYAMGLNILEWDNRYTFQKTFVINELLAIVDKLYDLRQTGGPLFEQYFRYALHLLLDDKAHIYTLTDMVRVFTDEDFRDELLARATDPLVKNFWEKQALQAKGDISLTQIAPYIVSKLTPFLANDLIRPIVNQKKTTLDFRKIMDEGKILIINLSKGVLGDINSYLIGLLVMAKITMAAFSRQDIPEEERRDFYLYIDEFQNVTTDSIATIFSEARKYHLNLFVGHQYLGQLKEQTLKAVFGNVGTIISFRVGNEDAEIMGKYFAPVFSASDVMNLDNFYAYVKLLINGQVARPFSMRLLKPIKSDPLRAKELEVLSNQKYTRLRALIEQEIRQNY